MQTNDEQENLVGKLFIEKKINTTFQGALVILVKKMTVNRKDITTVETSLTVVAL